MHSDFLELLHLLGKHKVKYLLIGGYAVGIHADPRATKDLDIWVEASLQNGKKLIKCLAEFGAPIDNLSAEEIKNPGLLYVFGIAPLRVDILNRVGDEDFNKAFKHKLKIKIGKTEINVVPKDVLIRMKKLAGRPQDKADLKKLKCYKSE